MRKIHVVILQPYGALRIAVFKEGSEKLKDFCHDLYLKGQGFTVVTDVEENFEARRKTPAVTKAAPFKRKYARKALVTYAPAPKASPKLEKKVAKKVKAKKKGK